MYYYRARLEGKEYKFISLGEITANLLDKYSISPADEFIPDKDTVILRACNAYNTKAGFVLSNPISVLKNGESIEEVRYPSKGRSGLFGCDSQDNCGSEDNCDSQDNYNCQDDEEMPISDSIASLAESGLRVLNIAHPRFMDALTHKAPQKWRVNLIGLGDVGANLLIGLRLLGGDCIERIGIYSRNENTEARFDMEINQIYRAFAPNSMPELICVDKDGLYDCDILIFAASKSVPDLNTVGVDVRLVQLDANREIISEYARGVRESGFDGIFAVVSDPVDHLCRAAYEYSNTDENGCFDMKGIRAENIKGFGLGVMNARAVYYSKRCSKDYPEMIHYESEGRAYGPHGTGLVIGNSLTNYCDMSSKELARLTREANLRVRDAGFKPYIAPAYSSGALSILAMLRGDWHYSSLMLDGVYFGMKNRLVGGMQEWEAAPMCDELFERLKETHEYLVRDSIKIVE